MERRIDQLTHRPYDVLVIGGGINGAAIAHMAALNKMSVALLEKGDFASGTSSKSTKLVHGGLRYLENLEFGLVRESLRERAVQLRSAPHIVHPLKFVIPVYEGDDRPLWMMKLGVNLYDLLSGKYVIEKHRVLTAGEVCGLIAGIKREGLLGGVEYSDAQMNDARLCLENVMSAVENGAHAANYIKVIAFIQENGRTVGVRARDMLGGGEIEVRAKRVVCAVGPWTNILMRKEHSRARARVRPTKGVHLIFKGVRTDRAVLIPTMSDKRIFFVIPWLGKSLVGTTDTDFTGNPDRVEVTREDIDYLISEANRVLPGAGFVRENLVASFAGLRPLVSETGAPARISRKHVIRESYSRMIYVMGGKYTTYRKIAEDVLRRLTKKPLVETRGHFPVYGSGPVEGHIGVISGKYGIPPETTRALIGFYGTRYGDVLKLIGEDAALKEPICSCSNVILAQVRYAIHAEMARTEGDIIMRRLTLGYQGCEKGDCRRAVQSILREEGL